MSQSLPRVPLHIASLYAKWEAQVEQIQALHRQQVRDRDTIEVLRLRVEFLTGKIETLLNEWQAERAQVQTEREGNRLAITALMLRLDRLEHGQREN